MRHAMFDLETLGVNPGCIILSIGVAIFDRNDILETFHAHIDIRDAEAHGLQVEAGTVLWWLDQPKEAQEALLKHPANSLRDVLASLSNNLDWTNIERVWCNGASFDFPILKAAHGIVNMRLPWQYYNEMDFRTFKNLFSKDDLKQNKVEPTLKHDALADAIAQAKTVQNLLRSVDAGMLKWAA